MTLEKESPGKVNLLLNILGKRPDGFHKLETVIHPVRVFDRLSFTRGGQGIQLTCSEPGLPTDPRNLVYRAAELFLKAAKIKEGVRVHLEKRIPLAAGLGGGSGNAATTLLGLNELFGQPLAPAQLQLIAAFLGSDIPFFLQSKPALATGRGERIQALEFFPALRGAVFLLIHPGFGIPTPWAYQHLARFPAALNGQPGRAQEACFPPPDHRPEDGGEGVLQFARSSGARKIPAAGLVPAIPPCQWGARHPHVRQRLDHFCPRPGTSRRRSVGRQVQSPGSDRATGLRSCRSEPPPASGATPQRPPPALGGQDASDAPLGIGSRVEEVHSGSGRNALAVPLEHPHPHSQDKGHQRPPSVRGVVLADKRPEGRNSTPPPERRHSCRLNVVAGQSGPPWVYRYPKPTECRRSDVARLNDGSSAGLRPAADGMIKGDWGLGWRAPTLPILAGESDERHHDPWSRPMHRAAAAGL